MYWFDGESIIPMRPGLARPALGGAYFSRPLNEPCPPARAAAALDKYLRSVREGMRRAGGSIPAAEIEPFFSRIEREEMTAEEVRLLHHWYWN